MKRSVNRVLSWSKWKRISLGHGKLRRTFPENLLKIVLFH